MLGSHPTAERLASVLVDAGLETSVHDELEPLLWMKLLINLGNAISALADKTTPEVIADGAYRRCFADAVAEGLSVLRRANIEPARYHGVPLSVMVRILRLPTPLVRLVLRRQVTLDPEARSSMWQDLDRGRRTEVDHLNGEIVRLAEKHGTRAPVNRAICNLIHRAEEEGRGPPGMSGSALRRALRDRD